MNIIYRDIITLTHRNTADKMCADMNEVRRDDTIEAHVKADGDYGYTIVVRTSHCDEHVSQRKCLMLLAKTVVFEMCKFTPTA